MAATEDEIDRRMATLNMSSLCFNHRNCMLLTNTSIFLDHDAIYGCSTASLISVLNLHRFIYISPNGMINSTHAYNNDYLPYSIPQLVISKIQLSQVTSQDSLLYQTLMAFREN